MKELEFIRIRKRFQGWVTWQTRYGTRTFPSWEALESWWWEPLRPSPPRSMSTTWLTGDWNLYKLMKQLIIENGHKWLNSNLSSQPCQVLPSPWTTWVPMGQWHTQVFKLDSRRCSNTSSNGFIRFPGFQTKTKRQLTSLGQNVWSWSAWWVSNSKPRI